LTTRDTTAQQAGGRTRREISLLPNYIVLIALTIFAIGPIIILFFNSLK
jgi:hypothetical protein